MQSNETLSSILEFYSNYNDGCCLERQALAADCDRRDSVDDAAVITVMCGEVEDEEVEAMVTIDEIDENQRNPDKPCWIGSTHFSKKSLKKRK